MPKSSFIVNSEFQPMSYQELLHPVVTQTQYQRELEEKYTQLDLQADKLEQLANSAVDRESYEKYKAYADRLREEASNLSKYGLRGRDNSRFMELFRLYGKEIQPLLDALQKRERLIAMQLQLSMQDPTSLYDRSAGNISLEELMANPSAAPVRQSGELLRALAQAMAINLQNELKKAVFEKAETPGYLAFRLKYGLSSEEVARFVSNPNSPEGSRVLRAIFDLVMTSSGVKENWEGDAYNRAVNYVTMGLWSAIGKEVVQPLNDVWALQKDLQAFQEKMLDKQLAALRRALRAAARAARAANGPLGRVNAWVQGNLSPKQIDANRKKINEYARRKYIVLSKDGKRIERITDAGMRALFDKSTKSTMSSVGGIDFHPRNNRTTTYAYFNQDFYNFMSSRGILTTGATKKNGKWLTDRAIINRNLNTFYTNNELGYDLNYSGKIVLNWGSAGNDLMRQALPSVTDSEKKKYKLSDSDFRDIQKGSLVYTLTDGNSITMRIQGNSGKYYDVPINPSMNRSLYKTITAGAQLAVNINTYLLKLANGETTQLPKGFDAKGNPTGYYGKTSQKDIDDFIIYYQNQLDSNYIPQVYINQSSLYSPMHAKPTTIDPALGTYGVSSYSEEDPYGSYLDGFYGN